MADFKASFIPKKPMGSIVRREERLRGGIVGILGFASFVIFLVTLAVLGGLFVYKAVLQGQIDQMSASIERVKQAIEPELIDVLGVADKRLQTSSVLLGNHLVISPVLRLLEDLTLSNVRFDSLAYSVDGAGLPTLKLSGEARDYAALALQSDIFGDARVFAEPIFENLTLNDQGNISFDFSTPVSSSFVLYKNHLNPQSRAQPGATTSASPAPASEAGTTTPLLLLQ